MSDKKTPTIYTSLDIKNYLTGRMSHAEMHAIEKDALDDPLLAEAMEGYQAADTKDWNKVLIELKEKLPGGENVTVIPINKNSFAGWWKIAAALLVLASSIVTAYLFTAKHNTAKSELAKITVPNDTIKFRSNQLNIADSVANESTVATTNKNKLNKGDNLKITTREKVQTAQLEQSTKPADKEFIYKPGNTQPSPSKDDRQAVKNINDLAGRSANDINNNELAVNTQSNAVNKENEADVNPVAANINVPKAIAKEQKAIQFKTNNYYSVQVVDATNKPLQFAQIQVNSSQKTTYTNEKGYFTIASSDSLLNIKVTAAGYLSQKLQLQNTAVTSKIILDKDNTGIQELANTRKKAVTAKPNIKKATNLPVADEEEDEEVAPVIGWDAYNNYLSKNLLISDHLKASNIHGVVELFIQLKKNGDIAAIKIIKSLCAECDAEAIRLIKKGPRWDVKNKKEGKIKVKVQF